MKLEKQKGRTTPSRKPIQPSQQPSQPGKEQQRGRTTPSRYIPKKGK